MLETVTTDKLQTGDIVINYGMRIRLGDLRTYPADNGRTVYAFAGTVENIDAIREKARQDYAESPDANSWSATCTTEVFIASQCDGPNRDQWRIQGNQLASWVRERY